IRTKAALAAARERGVTLGTAANMTANGRYQGQQQNRADAIAAYAQTVGYARLLQQQGLSLAQIAARLNAEGFKTRQNKSFYKMTVKRILDRGKSETVSK
ncbi:MAG: recombinase family protein, partial [Anaerolineales bacterium]|nr:recombinase family protein [Anaerolineales bacterium]